MKSWWPVKAQATRQGFNSVPSPSSYLAPQTQRQPCRVGVVAVGSAARVAGGMTNTAPRPDPALRTRQPVKMFMPSIPAQPFQ